VIKGNQSKDSKLECLNVWTLIIAPCSCIRKSIRKYRIKWKGIRWGLQLELRSTVFLLPVGLVFSALWSLSRMGPDYRGWATFNPAFIISLSKCRFLTPWLVSALGSPEELSPFVLRQPTNSLLRLKIDSEWYRPGERYVTIPHGLPFAITINWYFWNNSKTIFQDGIQVGVTSAMRYFPGWPTDQLRKYGKVVCTL